jgi:hypothetical protein
LKFEAMTLFLMPVQVLAVLLAVAAQIAPILSKSAGYSLPGLQVRSAS